MKRGSRYHLLALVLIIAISSGISSAQRVEGQSAPQPMVSLQNDPVQVLNAGSNYFLKIDMDDPRVHPKVIVANKDSGGLQPLYGMKQRLEGQGYAQWAIINGDLFSPDCPGGTNCGQGLTYINGQRKDNWYENGPTWRARGNIGFDSSGNVEINLGDTQSKRYMTIAGGPRIVMGGGSPTCNPLYNTSTGGKTFFPDSGEWFDGNVSYWCSDTRPITMIGYSADGRHLFMGVSKGGQTPGQLAQWLKNQGAHEILRFDSGSSTGMYHNGSFVGGTGGKSIANAFAIYVDSGPPPPQPCSGPSLQEPANGYSSGNTTLTFRWSDVSCDHTGFTFRVKTVPDMESGGEVLISADQGSTQRTETFGSQWINRDLYWSVRAAQALGGAAWAPARVFRLVNNPPTISFDTANGQPLPGGPLYSRERAWTFRGTAGDPEGRLDRIDFHCAGDGCGYPASHTSGTAWAHTQNELAGRNDLFFTASDGQQTTDSRHLDLRIDLAPPGTTLSLNGDADPLRWPGWFTAPVQVRLQAVDGATGRASSGVREIRYRLDAGSEQVRSGADTTFTVSNDGIHTITYFAVDNVGNPEGGRTISFKLDQTPPAAPSSAAEVHGVANDQWQNTLNTPTFTWAASGDATSGLWGYQLSFGPDPNGQVVHRSITAAEPRQWTPQPGGVRTGTYYLRLRAGDSAGNWSAWTTLFTFRYDGTPPENPTGVTHAAGVASEVWQRTTSTADFSWATPHDEGSGIKDYLAYWGSDPAGTSASALTTGRFQSATPLCGPTDACTGYLRLRSRDNVGNQANDWSTAFVLRYDNVPPVADFNFSGNITQTTQTLLTLNINASDAGSGVRAMRLSGDGLTWTPWEQYATERLWSIPAISRQYWPVYLQVRDGVGLESAVISRTIYLDVNPGQPHSAGYRLFDRAMSAGSGAHTSTSYQGHSTVGQVADSARSTSAQYVLVGGYEASSRARPLTQPGHDDYMLISGIFASGSGAIVLHSVSYRMRGTLGEPGLPNNETTLTSQQYLHRPGFLASFAPRFTTVPTQTLGPPPRPEPVLPCAFPRLSIDDAALFTNSTNVTLNICAPKAVEMLLSNDGGFAGAQWEPYAESKAWTLTAYGQYVLPRFVYAAFKDANGTIYNTYFDDIIYDPTPPSGTVSVESSGPLGGQAMQSIAASQPGIAAAPPLALLSTQSTGSVSLSLSGQDDNSGLAEMQISDDASFAGASWESYTAVKSWAPGGEDGTKTVYARFRDSAGNISDVSSASFVLDTQAPIGGMAFEQRTVGPETLTVTLHLDAQDNLSGVTDMRLSTSANFADAVWLSYTAAVTWYVHLSGQPQETVYAQYRDLAKNVSEVYSDTYLMDTAPPVIYIEAGAGATLTRNLSILAYDELSALGAIHLSNDPLLREGVVTLPFTNTISWTFDERRVVWVQVEDDVGNATEPYPVYAPDQRMIRIYLAIIQR